MKKLTFCLLLATGISIVPFCQTSAQNQKRYYLVVNNSDNGLKVFINNKLIYDKWTEDDPTFSESIDITDILQLSIQTGYVNKIRVAGINAQSNFQGPFPFQHLNNNPWHFKFNIVVVDQKTLAKGIIYDEDLRGASPISMQPGREVVFEKVYDLIKER